MSEFKICRICLDGNVRMHQITGSEVQDVYEKITNNKVQEDARLHIACYICYCQLKKCQQLVIKSRKSEKFLKQIIPFDSEMNPKLITFSDRMTYGLVNSLMVSKMESFELDPSEEAFEIPILKQNETINTEKSDESGGYEVLIKFEPAEDNESKPHTDSDMMQESLGASPTAEPPLIANEQDKVKPIENEKQKNVATGKKSYKCELCDYTSIRRNDLNRHVRFHTGERPYKCQYCSFTGTTSGQLNVHIRSHTGEKPFKCQYCNYGFAQSSSLKIHIRTHTGEKPYECQYCSYRCSENGSLRAHIRTHTGEKPFKCQYCSYTCKRNSNLKTHIRTHTGGKPYKCQHCSFTCTTSSYLKVHNRTHTGEKPYKCQYCNYAFSQNVSLQTHLRTHTGEKPFKCQYCSYSCNRNSNLKLHIRTHTGGKPYACDICDKKFTAKATLKKHLLTHNDREGNSLIG